MICYGGQGLSPLRLSYMPHSLHVLVGLFCFISYLTVVLVFDTRALVLIQGHMAWAAGWLAGNV